MSRGIGLDHVAAVLSDSAGWVGAASDDVDEADHWLWVGRGGGIERGAVGPKAAEAKLLRINRVRADTTVVAANVCYPTGIGQISH